MNKDELIEAIIKEVKRVLAERGISVSPVPGETLYQAETSPVKQPLPASVGTAQPASPQSDYMIGSRDLTGKQVITQKDLETYRGTAIRVTRNAVITPLAVDYAREKGITITRVHETTAAAGVKVPAPETVGVALVFAPDFPGDRGIVNAILSGKGFKISDFSEQNYESAVKKLSNAVVSGSVHFGVCIERSGMEGPIHANRNPRIRAVHCRATFDARAARVDYGANVIVIDSTSDPDAVISGFSGLE